jgi:hypothetical protein
MTATPSNSNNASPDEKHAKLRAFLNAKKELAHGKTSDNSGSGQQSQGNSKSFGISPSETLISNPSGWLDALDDAVKLVPQSNAFPLLPPANLNVSPAKRSAGNRVQSDEKAKSQILGTKSRSAPSTLERAEQELHLKSVEDRKDQESQKSLLWITGIILTVSVFVIIFFVYRTSDRMSKQFFRGDTTAYEPGSNSRSQPSTSKQKQFSGSTSPTGLVAAITGAQTKRVQLEAGVATFTINRNGPHHLHVVFNSGLIADADWKENSLNDFGYDIYEPQVSQVTNKLALMIMLRGIIANYLNGKY